MNKTKIEWCDSTWNPVVGCKHDCEYCYARRIARRFCSNEHGHDGLLSPCDGDCQACSEMDGLEFVGDKLRIARKGQGPYPYGFMPTLHSYRLDEPQRQKKPQTIFVCSMADLFGAWVPIKWIVDVLDACRAAPQHRYMFLTKNPDRYAQLDALALLPHSDNFWYGSTITSRADKRFQGSPLMNTFLSIEPLHENLNAGLGSFGSDRLIIIGAETGSRAGKITPEKAWVDNICEAADLTHAAVFMKDSLIPVVGRQNMRREFPPEFKREAQSNA